MKASLEEIKQLFLEVFEHYNVTYETFDIKADNLTLRIKITRECLQNKLLHNESLLKDAFDAISKLSAGKMVLGLYKSNNIRTITLQNKVVTSISAVFSRDLEITDYDNNE